MNHRALPLLVTLAVATPSHPLAKKQSDETTRITDAALVVQEFAKLPEGAPRGLMKRSAGVVVIPGLVRAGFMVGGKHGSGVLCAKDSTGAWCQPVFVKLTGGSIGWQIGVSSTDLVLVFMREKNIGEILDGEFTVGGDAAVAAGPVGREGSAGTSAHLDAEIYSYSRSRGAFAGVSIDGSKLYLDQTANKGFYGDQGAHDILKAKPPKGSAGESLSSALASFGKEAE